MFLAAIALTGCGRAANVGTAQQAAPSPALMSFATQRIAVTPTSIVRSDSLGWGQRLGGAIAAFRGRTSPAASAERARLEQERERLFASLTALESSHRAGRVDAETYAEQRRQLVVSLERVYAALDDQVAA